jgi:hypothetical protein
MLFVEDALGIFVVVGVVGGCRRILFAHGVSFRVYVTICWRSGGITISVFPDRSHCEHTVTTAVHRPLDVGRL